MGACSVERAVADGGVHATGGSRTRGIRPSICADSDAGGAEVVCEVGKEVDGNGHPGSVEEAKGGEEAVGGEETEGIGHAGGSGENFGISEASSDDEVACG